MIIAYIKKILHKLVLAERSPTKLALSFCLGVYLAFSPFVGLQTWLVFPICWLFKLNVTVTLSTLYLVSNPFTMVPIILVGYMFGQWLFDKVLHIDAIAYNPAWLNSFIDFLAKYVVDLKKHLGVDICFWCYMIGANILAILIAIALYPIMKRLFKKLVLQIHGNLENNENNNAK